MEFIILLIILGYTVGFIGSLVGLGGGFILVPIFLIIYPNKSPAVVTGMSLTIILFNSISGSISYISKKRVALQAGLVISLFSIPGTIIGSRTLKYIPKNIFGIIFAIFIIALSISLLLKKEKRPIQNEKINPKGHLKYTHIDEYSQKTTYYFKFYHAVLIGLFGGLLSSILGVGGGIIYIPALIYILGLPVGISAATSLFATSFTALSGSIQHLINGSLNSSLLQIGLIAGGVIIGAQFGARLATKLSTKTLSKLIAIILIIVAIRLLESNI